MEGIIYFKKVYKITPTPLRRSKEAMRQVEQPYVSGDVLRSLNDVHGLSTSEARSRIEAATEFVDRFLPYLRPHDWIELLKTEPKHMLGVLRQAHQVEQLEQSRIVKQEHPVIPGVSHAFRAGDRVVGGDTSDILPIHTVKDERTGLYRTYYWVHNLDFTGHGTLADKYREFVQTYMRGRLKEMRIRPENVHDKLRECASELHEYIVENLMHPDLDMYAQGLMGIMEVVHDEKMTHEVNFHYLDMGNPKVVVHTENQASALKRVYVIRKERQKRADIKGLHLAPDPKNKKDPINLSTGMFTVVHPLRLKVHTLKLNPGQTLAFWTDGLTHATDAKGKWFESKIVRTLRKFRTSDPEKMADALMGGYRKHIERSLDVQDDLRIRVLKFLKQPSGSPAIDLPKYPSERIVSIPQKRRDSK